MLLYHAPTSPFVRKVLVIAHETGLSSQIELKSVAPAPTAIEPDVVSANPLSKIPALVTEDGQTIHDSVVIADYLCARAGADALCPTGGPARWRELTLQSLGDGIADAALLMRFEAALRPRELFWSEWQAGQRAKIESALAHLEGKADELGWAVGAIAIACALGYLDLRHPDFAWRAHAPRLGEWFDQAARRPSMQETAPPA